MHGSFEPEERIMEPPTINEQIASIVEKLNWEKGDDIVVEIGGTVISGIHQGEDYNKKWATPFGVRKYNKDAFIIISNQSRRDLTKSQPLDREHKPHHAKEIRQQDQEHSDSNSTGEPQEVT